MLTAATAAPAWSSRTDAKAGGLNSRPGKKNTTAHTGRFAHVFAHMKCWKILRDCRLKGAGVHHAMLGVARLHNLAVAQPS
ncbi:hypothetical protein GCM10009566_01120 [Streptomyces murinus]